MKIFYLQKYFKEIKHIKFVIQLILKILIKVKKRIEGDAVTMKKIFKANKNY
jgi:hypothetical protein